MSEQKRSEENQSFWTRVFSIPYHSEREERALAYIIHRIHDAARLQDVVQEEYVRRILTPEEINQIVTNPDLVHAAREQLEQTFRSGELDPNARRR